MSLYSWQYRPLPSVWPSGQRTPSYQRQRSRFRSDWNRTMNDLEREFRAIDVPYGSTVVVEAGYQEWEIRVDGLPRANARLHDPAIVLNFQSKFGPLRYGCDTYDDHLANLRAIALALEALRAVDRYGVTKRGEQYQGWKALPETTMSQHDAKITILQLAELVAPGQPLPMGADLLGAYRKALKRVHPDIPGTGDRVLFEQLVRAAKVLGI